MSFKAHTNCRACGYGPAFDPGGMKSAQDTRDHLESVLNFGVMPLPNAFVRSGEAMPGYYPLELQVCPRCTLGQLSTVVDPAVIYQHYAYVTSPSQTMAKHFEALWSQLNQIRKIEHVVEIGSNDGLCLEYFRKFGAQRVLGIDPATNLVQKAKSRGIDTLNCMFDRQAAEMARSTVVPVDLVLARHVFCHVDNWQEFINNCAAICEKDTLVCIEVPHAHDLITRCEWDTIYAEHTSYLSIKAMQHLLDGSAMKLQKVLHFTVHGGVIVMILRRRDCEEPRDGSIMEYLDYERCSVEDWRHFSDAARDQINSLSIMVRDLRAEGKRVCGYGASAKSTMWVNACKFTKRELGCIYDCTEEKWYTFSPGSNIPIRHEGSFYADDPEYAIMFCWNYQDEVVAKQKNWIEGGGKFIIPVPKLQVISKNGKSLL